MAKKGHSMGNIKAGSVKRVGKEEYEATVSFANGVVGTGRGKSKPEAQRAAVDNAKGKGGIGLLTIVAIILLGAAI